MSLPINLLEDEARKRKDRLLAFRAEKLGLPTPVARSSDVRKGEGVANRHRTAYERDHNPAKTFVIGGNHQQRTLEEEVALFAKEALDQEDQRKKEVDIFNLAPRKANWDLKRDLQKKRAKLERKTQSSIADIIRNRLSTAGNMEDINGGENDSGTRRTSNNRPSTGDDLSDED
ncbi:hypothetical protein M427DRAFT_60485 [Gonapodya prolifera JEL478]|uniref:mRNA splicing factor n=1 Tax=Gonapodya prolifera (strain JEL478) TaxID=1344416 RepID=A0A139A477_GONPJ|nr:hypothetical protein M427DRAFT_60485 [Gonapodya prolifera JEL478]|eukprot:KXS11626.1 hypothetical protein M427DRAFT_60485 [Gonapodya prolifera JEL478]